MNEPAAVEETVQVTSAPSTPHELGTETPVETPEATPEVTPAPETPEVSPEQQEFEDLATEADNLATGTEITPPAEQPQQQPPSMEQTVTWLANTIYDWQKNGFPSQQQPQQQESAEPGATDIYNSGLESPEETQDNTPTLQDFQAMQQELQQLRGVVEGVHASTTSLEKTSEEQRKQQEENREITSLESEYNLSSEDARRTYIFLKNGEYAKGMRFARGRSQVETATEQMVEQRANDRGMAGRPAVPGGTAAPLVASGGLLQTKLAEYRAMPDGPDKDEAVQWLIDNGGVEELRKEIDSFHRNPPVPAVNTSIL